MNITNYLPMILRYALVSLATLLATRGWIDGDQNAIISQNLDAIVGALIALWTVAWAIYKRPSQKALDAAKEIDKQLPKDAPVVIKTPGAQPDIIVSGDKS
ncbi:hypothetical protein [Rhizobium sp. Leaf383]|uniref:Pam3-gp28 family putative phage holin n=1 Tax=Rhizobium sp. Leaf383 TaxID=1736357 RepID=UPI000714698A|nr:hypothetical protein [Rhizobium sp. Leaf383]KQS86928.1 hypothetical protein ASG58_01380 [Rhizobium sp. Leaf383]